MVADAFGDNAFSRRLRIDGREGRGKIFARFHLPDSRKQRQFHQLYLGARPQRLPQARGRRRTRDGVCSGRCRIRQLSPGKIRNDGRRSGPPSRSLRCSWGCPHDPVRLHSRGFSLFLDGLFRRRNGHRRRCVLQVQDLRRPAIEEYTDPLNRRKVKIFSREKYMPVFSTRMFAKRGISDAEGDYRLLFPDVNWQGCERPSLCGQRRRHGERHSDRQRLSLYSGQGDGACAYRI